MPAEVGDRAPDFTLPADSWEREVSLEEVLREGPVVLFFYPGTGRACAPTSSTRCRTTCRSSLAGEPGSWRSAWIPVVAPGVGRGPGITFPLLSDFLRGVARDYGVLNERGFAERAYFVIDRDGRIRARRVERTPRDRPPLERVLGDLDGLL